ncbi:MAG: hypothetical protein MJ236_04620 [Clostridia bacterium]|nr:hypothetical protein [Clostridia bacterium]
MVAYSIIMFLAASLFLFIGIKIHNGDHNLVHDYHQSNVKEDDLKKYNKNYACGMFISGFSLLASGIVALIGKERIFTTISIVVLLCGLLISIVIFVFTQYKFNNKTH